MDWWRTCCHRTRLDSQEERKMNKNLWAGLDEGGMIKYEIT